MPDLIETILPANRVHLLAGVSDAGKTRFILPTMLDWAGGLNILGRKSHPVPWAYVAGDRVLAEAQETVADMGLPPDAIRIIPAFGKHNKGWFSIRDEATKMSPRPQLLVIEGFSDLCGTERTEVREFLGIVSAACEDDNLTVLGVVESPKLKSNETYLNPRQRVSGVSAWGYHSSTVIFIDSTKDDPSFERPDRTIWVCTKRGQRRAFPAAFDDMGRLVATTGSWADRSQMPIRGHEPILSSSQVAEIVTRYR